MSWEEAKSFCHSNEAKLVEIETATEDFAITNEIENQGIGDKKLLFWLGVVNIANQLPKKWVYDSTKEIPLWENWAWRNGDEDGENCVFLWAFTDKQYPVVTLGSWHDIRCNMTGFTYTDPKTFLSIAALCGKH